jgi:hypothetical protein
MDDVEQTHDVGVVHILEQRDLADSGGRDAFIFSFQADLLESDDAVVFGGEVLGFVYDSISA